MDYDPMEISSYFDEPVRVDPLLQLPPPTMRHHEDTVYYLGVPQPAPRIPERQPTRYVQPVNRAVKPPCQESWYQGYSIPRPLSPGPKQTEARHRIQERSTRSQFMAPYPAHSNRVSGTVDEGPVMMTSDSAGRMLPLRGGIDRTPSECVWGPIGSERRPDPKKVAGTMKVANLLSDDKKVSPSEEANLLRRDKVPTPHPSSITFEEQLIQSTSPGSTTKAKASSPIAPPRRPDGGVPNDPPDEKETDALARLKGRLGHLLTYVDQNVPRKEFDAVTGEFKATAEIVEWVKQLRYLKHEAALAWRCVGTSASQDRDPTQPQMVSAQTASKVVDRKAQQHQKATDSLAGTGKRNKQPPVEKYDPAQAAHAHKNASAQITGNNALKIWNEFRSKPRIPQSLDDLLTQLEARYLPKQTSSDNKSESSSTIVEPGTPPEEPEVPQEEFEELVLESDEEEWEKIDGQDEWEIVDDPRVEVERKANLQRKVE